MIDVAENDWSEPQFTVCCLFYGDYPDYAERLLKSLTRPAWYPWFRLRIGMNAASSATQQRIVDFEHDEVINGDCKLDTVISGRAPYYKYPLMRRLFHQKPIDTPFVMWFDDDSYILPDAPDDWFRRVEGAMANFHMVGSIWRMRSGLVAAQPRFISEQPWYTGEPVRHGMKNPFITGGWWTIDTGLLYRWDWPPDVLFHNGGDMMLGELCRQQGYRMGRFTECLGINTRDRKCSDAPRRGASEQMLGWDYPHGDRWLHWQKHGVPEPLDREPVDWLDVIDGKVPIDD